jgi:putative transposase
VYAAIFIDAIYVKVRDGQVGNQPFYAAIGVDLNRQTRRPGPVGRHQGGGESAKFWIERADRPEEPRRGRRVLRRL